MTDTTLTSDVPAGDNVSTELEAPVVQEETIEAEPEDSDTDGGGEDGGEADGEDKPFPKKAVNALNRAKRNARQLKAEVRQLQAELSQLKNFKPSTQNEKPDPNKFESYTDYNAAQVEYQIKTRMEEAQNKGKLEAVESQHMKAQAARDAILTQQAQEVAKALPDMGQVISRHTAALDSIGGDLKEIIYDLDNAPLAIYTLAKEGRLEDVLSSNPYLAAAELLSAQSRGAALLGTPKRASAPAQQNTSLTPEPIRAVRGTGTTTSKPIQERSGSDLLKWMRS